MREEKEEDGTLGTPEKTQVTSSTYRSIQTVNQTDTVVTPRLSPRHDLPNPSLRSFQRPSLSTHSFGYDIYCFFPLNIRLPTRLSTYSPLHVLIYLLISLPTYLLTYLPIHPLPLYPPT